MKHFTFKWLKRLYILIAIKLVILAVLLSSARLLFLSVEDYKQQAIDWLTSEYHVDISVQDISAGIDFTGMILILNNVELLDSAELPFILNFEYLFLHLDLWDSVTKQKLTFNRISLQGANLTLKNVNKSNTSKESLLTIDKLKDIFLTQLKKVSVKESTLSYVDKFGHDKVIIIEQLRWLNEGNKHQGIGLASFPYTLGTNSLKFVVDVFPETKKSTFAGNIYLQAENLNITDYLDGQINSNAELSEAIVGFDAWAKFSANKIDNIQVEFTQNQFSWSQQQHHYQWSLNGGALQLTNSDNGWLLDSYDLTITKNKTITNKIKISANGDENNLLMNFEGLRVKQILPFYFLHSTLTNTQITSLQEFDLDANITQFGLSLNGPNGVQFSLKANEFKNNARGAIPGINDASIVLQGDLKKGRVDIDFSKQKIDFGGLFSRKVPLQSGLLDVQWLQMENGLKLFSEQTLLITDELNTHSAFSLFLPNENASNKSPFLSLYSDVSLNDAGKVKYYLPVKKMGKKVYEYLEPTLKKGHVKGAKVLWYGALNQYPYSAHNGIFQAWIPIRDAQYDFFEQWQGLTHLDINLFFENDSLEMKMKKGFLGEINIAQLSAKVNHLKPNGMLTLNASFNDDAYKIDHYFKGSPMKNSLGEALSVIAISKPVKGDLRLTVPFNRKHQKTKIEGRISFENNDLKVNLSDDLVIPLHQVNGSVDFVNGDLTSNNIKGNFFEQTVAVDFTTKNKEKSYQVDIILSGIWSLDVLKETYSELEPLYLSGELDWSALVNFTHYNQGGYQYNVALESATQGVSSKLPSPFYKHALESWPMRINLSGRDNRSRLQASIKDILAFDGQLDHAQGPAISPYFTLNIGQSEIIYLDKNKQVINVNLADLNLTHWYQYWTIEENKKAQYALDLSPIKTSSKSPSIVSLDEINVNVDNFILFNQPLAALHSYAVKKKGKWQATITSDNLQMQLEHSPGIPVRFDVKAKKVNLQELDLSLVNSKPLDTLSKNLLNEYPELFIDCEECIYKNIDVSPLSMHVYPTKKRLNIDYIKVGNGSEHTLISGFWDQRITNIIFDIQNTRKHNWMKRLGYVSPVNYKKAQLSGAINWLGAPWQANFNTLNGHLSGALTDGAITEVSDKGTRLLSIFSLDSLYRSLNVEFDNVFGKGFNFDKLTFSGNINDGVTHNDDFYLSGSAGKIIGNGLIDLSNQDTNYNFSYSPAVTSSLPVLAAFAINPLTGAAVLMITKLFEPVVDAIIRVDFTVKGDLTNPDVKLVSRKRGKVKLENSEVLQQMTEQQAKKEGRDSDL